MRTRLIRLAVVSIVVMSCRSTEPTATQPAFTGQWQGREWKGDASVRILSPGATGDTLYVMSKQPVQTGDGIYEEWLTIHLPFHGAGTYVLDSASVVVRVVIGGDVIGASYHGLGANAGVLEITDYGSVDGHIEGTVWFNAGQEGYYAQASSMIREFKSGHFRATVVKGYDY